jgi:hypothetical protein
VCIIRLDFKQNRRSAARSNDQSRKNVLSQVSLRRPTSVDLAGRRVIGMAALGVVLVFEVADHHAGFEQVGPVVAVEALPCLGGG